MSRTLSTKNQAGVVLQATIPIFLVEFGFGSPLRFSSRQTVAVSGGNTFFAAGIRVNLEQRRVELFNESLLYSTTFMSTAGITAKVWKVYGVAPFATADLDMVFDGQIGPCDIGATISIGLRESPPVYAPRIMIAPPLCNNLPPDGALWIPRPGPIRSRGTDMPINHAFTSPAVDGTNPNK